MSIFITILTLIIFLVPSTSFSQKTQIYKHPSLNFQFEASKDWIKIPHSEDTLIFEMMSPDSSMYVRLWYTETEQNDTLKVILIIFK